MQDVFNLLPNLGIEELTRSFAVQSNDMMLAIYLAALTRLVLALHNLIDNKVCNSSCQANGIWGRAVGQHGAFGELPAALHCFTSQLVLLLLPGCHLDCIH